MTVVFWILVGITIIVGGFSSLLFFSGWFGKADPTDHGNIVAMQFGVVGFVFTIILAVLAFVFRLLFL